MKLLILSLALIVVACESGTPDAASFQQLDSAGIPVVMNAAPTESVARWRIADPPRFQIGLADGPQEYLFDRVFGGAILSDGTVVVANVGTFELRLFDAGGAHLRSVGREGDGPGEFRNLRLAGSFAGDSLLAYDMRLRRATVFTADLTLVRSNTIPEARETTRSVGVLSDGSFVLARSPASVSAGGLARMPWSIDVLTPEGEVRVSLGVFPGSEGYAVVPPDGGYTGIGVPFGRDVAFAVGRDRIVVGTDDAFSFRHYDASGAVVRVIRLDQQSAPVDPAELESIIAGIRSRDIGRLTPYRDQALAEMPRHTTKPAFRSPLIDRDLNLWVRSYANSFPGSASWTVFDPEGKLVALVELPGILEVLDVTETQLLATVRDELGVERVRLYDLLKDGVRQ
jgi:hypothetical protein